MKCIVFGEMFPVCFHDAIVHRFVKARSDVGFVAPTSAGFCKIRDGKVITYGRSESLNLDPSEDDAELIQEMLFGGGV